MAKLKLISAADTQYPSLQLKSINEQRSSGLFCDVTIIIQDRKFKAHKSMLSASSSYFRQLFSVSQPVVELDFIKPDIFEVILNYIYTSRICRVRSDRLEDLISGGQTLGVTFIANLGVPLAHVNVLSKDEDNADNSTNKYSEGEIMPIITEAFSISAEEFHLGSGNMDKEVALSERDDVLFVSTMEAPKSQKTKASNSNNAEVQKSTQEEETKTDINTLAFTVEDIKPPNQTQSASSPATSTIFTSPVRTSSSSGPTTPSFISNLSPDPHTTPEANTSFSVQKKNILSQTSDFPGKLLLSDVRSNYSANVLEPNFSGVTAKQTITSDKASEIDSLSSGCKVYANIGENTYDIVPVRQNHTEGAAFGRKTQPPQDTGSVSNLSPKSNKKPKMEEDHYEIVMDGKTFYVCMVCKRPYVCLTSLRRHYNTHSWERKYPCHYCSKVFALAEYRTKHEITHTGERRYQCLLCKETFLNYQILSTHCKQAHNQDPSGRKEKDESGNNLYRLLPCKTLQMKPYSFVSDESQGVPVIREDAASHTTHFTSPSRPSSEGKPVTWDEIFTQPRSQTCAPDSRARLDSAPRPIELMNLQSTSEFSFGLPETY